MKFVRKPGCVPSVKRGTLSERNAQTAAGIVRNAAKAIEKVQNGSILLYHARHKDYVCLETLIPQLLEAGFEPVTVSELFGFPPPETSEELYVYDIHKILGK